MQLPGDEGPLGAQSLRTGDGGVLETPIRGPKHQCNAQRDQETDSISYQMHLDGLTSNSANGHTFVFMRLTYRSRTGRGT